MGSFRSGPPAGPVGYGTPAGRWILLATVLGSTLAFVDATVVNIALPAIGTDLDAGSAGLQWIINGYTLSLAALILLGGSLGDRYGRRRLFVVGVAWFALASLLCGLAPNVPSLIAARVLQGIGGALLTPGALAILETSFDQRDRARAIGAWSGLAGIGGALGPFLGGWLVEAGSWRLVFLVNVPLAAAVIAVAVRHVPESRDPYAARQVDVAGAVAGAVGLGGLTYGFTSWPGLGGSHPVVLATLAVGAAGLAAFVLVERRSAYPMLPLQVFSSRTFTAVNLVTFTVYAALGAVFFLVVLNLQVVVGFGPTAAGTALLPVTALMLLLSARAGQLGQRIGARIPMTVGPLLCAASLVLFSRVGPGASYRPDVLPATLLLGLGLSLTVAPMTAIALSSVADRYAGVASGVNNAVARAAALLAVAVLPLAAGLGTGSLTTAATLAPAYRTAMLLCAAVLVVGAVIAAAAIPGRPVASRAPSPVKVHCAVDGTPLHPRSVPAGGAG